MWLLTTNSMRASPTPSAGKRHQRNAAAGLARLSITWVRVSGMADEIEVFGLIIGDALVNEPSGRPPRRKPSPLLIVEDLRRIAGTDDGRQTKFAADDGRVRRASAVIGDDCGGPLHDRHPIRVRGLRDQDCAV